MIRTIGLISHILGVFFIVFVFPPLLVEYMGLPLWVGILQMFGTIFLLNIWADYWEIECKKCGHKAKNKDFIEVCSGWIDVDNYSACPHCGYYYNWVKKKEMYV